MARNDFVNVDGTINYNNIASKPDFDTQVADIASQKIVNVKLFGAKGDGITNDKLSIQSAIDSITQGIIYFPPGVYMIKGIYAVDYAYEYPARQNDGLRLKNNLTFEGNHATITSDLSCAFIFDTAIRHAVTTDAEALHDITFRNLTFTKELATFAPTRSFCHLLQIESCINLLIENCKFTGWTGDAICIGTLAWPDLEGWYQTVVRNVRILNCDFDGVNKQNRQGISIVCGEDITIENCNFARTTFPGQPGAIDIEPDRIYEYANNIHIRNCKFDDIGTTPIVAAIAFSLVTPLSIQAKNFSVTGCSFTNCVTPYKVIGIPVTTPEALDPLAPTGFEFSKNTIKNCIAWFSVGGVDDVTIRDETVDGVAQAAIGSSDYLPNFLPVSRFNLTNNNVKNMIVVRSVAEAPIGLNANVLGSTITGNTFIDCGNQFSVGDYALFKVFTTTLANHKNIYYADNVCIKTGAKAFLDVDTVIFGTPALIYPATILVKDNNVINIKQLKAIDGDIYRYAKVVGTQGIVSADTWFNSASSYTEATLPDDLPLGFTVSANGTYMLITFKARPRDILRYNNMQMKYDSGTNITLMTRRPDISTNTWLPWVTFTGV